MPAKYIFNGNSVIKLIVLTFVFTSSASPSKAIVRIYDTNFESFNTGEINGQQSWTAYDPANVAGGGGFATITNSAPSATGKAVQFQSGTGTTSSPRYAESPAFGPSYTSAVAQGETTLYAQLSMYFPSGQASVARQGAVVYDSTGSKILTGFYVQASTGLVYMLGNYDNAGTVSNYAFNTKDSLGNRGLKTG